MQSRVLPYLSLCQELVSVATSDRKLELATDFGQTGEMWLQARQNNTVQ